MLEKTLECPLDYKEIQPVNPKGNQSWIFNGRTDAEAETPILWPPDAKNWLMWKDPNAGKDWRQEEKGMTEDEIDGWMASPTLWTWVWVNSRSWQWTGRPGKLQSVGLQRVGYDWMTDMNWTELKGSPCQNSKTASKVLNFCYICLFIVDRTSKYDSMSLQWLGDSI